jgi:SAM-dependent methyltransferase
MDVIEPSGHPQRMHDEVPATTESRHSGQAVPVRASDEQLSTKLAYWNSVAPVYDSLYTGGWSRAEDATISRSLKTFPGDVRTRILDLACGTGLGYELCQGALGEIAYHGRDIAPQMLTALRRKAPHVQTSCGPMEQLGEFAPASFDVVVCFNGGCSYASGLAALLAEIRRVLVPGGWVYLSLLSRTSFRRLIRGKLCKSERFRTRGHGNTSPGVIVETFLRGEIIDDVADSGFKLVDIAGRGCFSGLCEIPALWAVSVALDRAFPWFGHTFEVVGRRRRIDEIGSCLKHHRTKSKT